jgi:hypothetical protein
MSAKNQSWYSFNEKICSSIYTKTSVLEPTQRVLNSSIKKNLIETIFSWFK